MGFFNLFPLSETYFSVILFFLSYYVCDIVLAGCRVLVPLASGVCPLLGYIGLGAYEGFLIRVTSIFPLVGGAGSCPSCGQGLVKESF